MRCHSTPAQGGEAPRSRGGEIEQGYFAGRIVNFFRSDSTPPVWSLTLPYPMIEGFSGSPILTDFNGPKVAGLGYGNRITRVLASEVVEVQDGLDSFRETINRVVEFGLAYHCDELLTFLDELALRGYTVSTGPGTDALEGRV